jgi:hypothetical protein
MPHPLTAATFGAAVVVGGGVAATVAYLAVAVRQLATLDAAESASSVLVRRDRTNRRAGGRKPSPATGSGDR